MNLELQWLLLGLPIAFALGWAASRFDLRQLKRERDDSPQAYFKGLNLLLNEQQDAAIDAFIQAVQNDPDTAELHFALGNLFRRRGEFERAVRVHEHLLGRSDLKAPDRARAQLALAQDFMKAGLFDRAETAWRALQGTAFDHDAQLALLSLYERSRDWPQAATVARKLEAGGTEGMAARLAHYECELAQAADANGQAATAQQALHTALEAAARANPPGARPSVLLGQRLRKAGQHQAAVAAWTQMRQQHPAAFARVAADCADSALQSQDPNTLQAATLALQAAVQTQPTVDVLRALDHIQAQGESNGNSNSNSNTQQRLPRLQQHVQRHPSLSAAQMLLDVPPAQWTDATWAALRQAVAHAAKPLQRYRCNVCGFEAQHHHWQCPGCLTWDSYPAQRLDEQ